MRTTTQSDYATMNYEFINPGGIVIDNLNLKRQDRAIQFKYKVKKGKEG